MQVTLFPEYFLEELEKTEGFLSQPLKVLHEFMSTASGLKLLEMIKSDQKFHGELKKASRGSLAPLERSGRPGMQAEVIFVFLVARGFLSGIYGDRSYRLLKENKAVLTALAMYGVSSFPGRSTIHENLSLLSINTLNCILEFQIQLVRKEGFDDFKKVTIDSTSVAADSAPPNTARLINYYSQKIIDILSQEKLASKRLEKHCNKILSLTFEILNCGRYKRVKQRRKALNRELLLRVDKVLNFLENNKIDKLPKTSQDALQPLYEGLYEMYFQVTKEFFPENYDGEAEQRHSISDEQAAFIKKGIKPAVFGYKFHAARSAQGFICGIVLNEQNPSDSKCFEDVVDNLCLVTKQIPGELSLDSGYCSKKNKKWAEKKGISAVSFSGGKGRRLLDDEEWVACKELRDFRATSEGLFSIMKDSYDLRRFSVRGSQKIKKLLLEKSIAYNFERMVKVALRNKKKKVA